MASSLIPPTFFLFLYTQHKALTLKKSHDFWKRFDVGGLENSDVVFIWLENRAAVFNVAVNAWFGYKIEESNWHPVELTEHLSMHFSSWILDVMEIIYQKTGH